MQGNLDNMTWSAKETIAFCALAILAGNIVDTSYAQWAPPETHFDFSEVEGKLPRKPSPLPGTDTSPLHACHVIWPSALHVGHSFAGQYQYLTADGYWTHGVDKQGAKDGRRRKVQQLCMRQHFAGSQHIACLELKGMGNSCMQASGA